MTASPTPQFRLHAPEELPAVVHATHWKAGSQWLHRILRHCRSERIVTPALDGLHLIGTRAEPGNIYPTVYAEREAVLACAAADELRIFVVIRDLRDTLVSWYFSLKHSHPIDAPHVASIRRRLNGSSVEEGLVYAIDDEFFRRNAAIQRSWIGANVPIVRYEDLLKHDEDLLVPLLTGHCDLGVSSERIREAVRACRFERLAGRMRGVEDVTSHFRRGEAGDWRRQFSPRVADAFAERYGETLRMTGYAADDRWVSEATAPSSRTTDVVSAPAERRRFSVIMLLPEHRGHYAEAVASWTKSQRYPDDAFEFILASDGAEPVVQEDARKLLRPSDRLLVFPGVKRSGLLDRAARLARFDHLVFTESHAVADSDFLRELDGWFARHPDAAGACCRTMPAYDNNFAWFDAVLHEEGYRDFRADDDWRKINIHAFALRRDWFVRAGGLDESYNLFSEMILAARLRELGGRMGYAPGPAVLHYFRNELGGPEESVREFVRDESLYRGCHPGPDQIGFSALPDVSSLAGGDHHLWIAALGCAVRRGLFDLQTWRLLPLLIRRLIAEWFFASGPRAAARRVGWSLRWHKLAAWAHRWNRAKLEPHYRELWRLYAVHERLLAVADRSPAAATLTITDSPRFIADGPGPCADGLHDAEVFQNQPFRWTRPLSVWRLTGLVEHPRITFRTHHVRFDLDSEKVVILLNGRRVPSDRIAIGPDALTVDLIGLPHITSKPTTLVLAVPPMRPWRAGQPDRRKLGLPVISVGADDPPVATVLRRAA